MPASFVPRACLSTHQGRNDLPIDFQPSNYDVICGRGKKFYNHFGNKLFRKTVALHLEEYSKASTKLDKSIIVSTILHSVRSKGDFVKLEQGRWRNVDDEFARERVGQTLRDALHHQYRSSTTAKRKRRQARQAQRSKIQSFDFTPKMNKLRVLTSSPRSDRQLMELFTQTNLDILNELNAARQNQPEEVLSAEAFPEEVFLGLSALQ
mmetsp:Transcript_32729/g.48467  ORF Transcript_32729/g.48467 Transcript_32729/m.48467 type:complete len:208 (-) Transcript_32729:13-636(-)